MKLFLIIRINLLFYLCGCNVDSSLFDTLYFNKIQNLNGYGLKIVAQEREYGYNKRETGYAACNGLELELMCTVLKHINASIDVKISSGPGHVNQSGPYGMIKDVLSKTVDINTEMYMLRGYWKLQAYPLYLSPLKMISLKEKVTVFERLRHIINAKTLVFSIVSCCACIIALKYIVEQSTSEAVLDFVRMFVAASTLKEPRNLSGKIFFLTIMFAVFTVSSYYQGIGRAIDTVPDWISHIDSVEDLIGSDLKIYGKLGHKEFMSNEEMRQRYYTIKNFKECNDRFLINERFVCLYSEKFLKFYIYKNQTIHISRHNVVERFATYTFGEDSPLLHEFDRVMQLMLKGGFVKLFEDRQERHFKKDSGTNDSEKRLKLTEFIVEFLILIVGLTPALLVFLFEITYKVVQKLASGNYRRHIKNNSKRSLQHCFRRVAALFLHHKKK